MGRQNVVVVFGLVFLAAIGLAAAASSPSPTSSPSKSPATTKTDVEAPISDDQIGTTGDDAAASPGDGDVAVAGPLGSDFIDITDRVNAKMEGGAVALSVSAVVVGVASIAGSFLLF